MKILFLMDQMYLHGGAERIVSQKMNYLLNHYKYEIYLITTEQKSKKPVYEIDSKVNWIDLNINYHREISYFNPKNLLKTILHFWRLKNHIQRIKPNLIISISFSPEQYFLPFIHKKIPKIKEFHSSRFNYKAGSWLKEKLDTTFEKYQALVVLNETEKSYYTNKNIVVIPNFTEFNSNINQLPKKEKTVIAAGRIAAVKQFSELIRIWKIASANFPNWKLKIFGDGEENDIRDLKATIESLDLCDNAFILPSTLNIQKEMQKASIYAMSSATECFPMVLLEAQASALPIISYDCPNGPRHIISNNIDGFLIEPNNKEVFAAQLVKMMLDENSRITFGKSATNNVLKYSKEIVMQQWNDLITKNHYVSSR